MARRICALPGEPKGIGQEKKNIDNEDTREKTTGWTKIHGIHSCAMLPSLALTNPLTLIFALQDVERRVTVGEAIVDLWQGLLLLVLIITGTHWIIRGKRKSSKCRNHQKYSDFYTERTLNRLGFSLAGQQKGFLEGWPASTTETMWSVYVAVFVVNLFTTATFILSRFWAASTGLH